MSDAEVVYSADRKSLWHYLHPGRTALELWRHRHLIRQFAVRDVAARYKGSKLGLLWAIVNPLLMLAIYTFVFSVVFKSRWGVIATDSKMEFALTMFCGLVLYNAFAECLNRAPATVVSNVNYVKKVVFPLEILPVSQVASAFFLALVTTAILLAAAPIFLKTFSTTVFLFPLVLVPTLLLTLGVSWFLASLGVYLRDIGHVVGVIVQVLFFVTPIFYPMTAVPAKLQTVMKFNPLTVLVESARATLLWSHWPDWPWLIGVTVASFLVAQLGYAWFMKTKRGFADVL